MNGLFCYGVRWDSLRLLTLSLDLKEIKHDWRSPSIHNNPVPTLWYSSVNHKHGIRGLTTLAAMGRLNCRGLRGQRNSEGMVVRFPWFPFVRRQARPVVESVEAQADRMEEVRLSDSIPHMFWKCKVATSS